MKIVSSVNVLFPGGIILLFLDVFQSDHYYCNAQDPLCDLESDSCPFQYDGECDNEDGLALGPCIGGDCYDCEPCRVYDFECNECLTNGCYFCPGDGTCFGSTLHPFPPEKPCSSESNFDFSTSCEIKEGNLFSDPLYTAQEWIYNMINVIPVWQQGILGTGVRVRVNDDGFDADHSEFDDRFDVDASCDEYLVEDPLVDDHGTLVMSIVGGGANNDQCAVGIAPGVTLSGCHGLKANEDEYLDEKLSMFDISVNSYGFDACRPVRLNDNSNRRKLQSCPFTFSDYTLPTRVSPCDVCTFPLDRSSTSESCRQSIIIHCQIHYKSDPEACLEVLDILIEDGRCRYNRLSTEQRERITNAIVNGRDGKGIIFVFAAGNEFATGEDINFEGFLNTRFTITVGAVSSDGLHASYSTPGAALFMTAPGGDRSLWPRYLAAAVGGGCTDTRGGTSVCAPVVAGVIALMLEVNPDLGWRDVQAILALTSKINVQDNDDVTRITNAAGYTHSNLYGFGLVDAEAAVNEAKTWNLLGPENMIMQESNELNILLPDDRNTVTTFSLPITTSMIDDMTNFIVESVVVYLDITHASRGDLDIILRSPQGTESILHPGNRPETRQDEQWKLLTVRNWGESAIGEWNLSITDISEGNVPSSDCFDYGFAVTILGLYVTCENLELNGVCNNGQFDESFFRTEVTRQEFIEATNDDGQTFIDACCVCGGGQPTNDVVNQLVSWQLVIYGQSIESSTIVNPTTDPPTKSPTSNPTFDPTSTPTSSPTTASPTSSPTTITPTSSPTTITPTSSPTTYPTRRTTPIPTKHPTSNPTMIPTTSNPTKNLNPNPANLPTSNPTTESPTTSTPTQNPTKITPEPTKLVDEEPSPSEIDDSSSNTMTPTTSPTSSSSPITSDDDDDDDDGGGGGGGGGDVQSNISDGQTAMIVLSDIRLTMLIVLISTTKLFLLY